MPNNFAFATIFEFYIWKISTPLCRNQRRVSSQCLLVSVLCYCTASSHLFSEILCGNEIICQEPSKSGAQVVRVIHEWKKSKKKSRDTAPWSFNVFKMIFAIIWTTGCCTNWLSDPELQHGDMSKCFERKDKYFF